MDQSSPAFLRVDRFDNGLTLVMEHMPEVRSAGMALAIVGGVSTDPEHAVGSANLLSDWILRGAGGRDARALSAALDSLGVQRSCAADTVFLRFSASMLAKTLPEVLPLVADIFQRPQLPESGFAPCREMALGQLEAIEDEPAQKLNMLLRSQHLPPPLGRPALGIKEHLLALTVDDLRLDYRRRFTPDGAILSIAGHISFDEIHDLVAGAFGNWQGPKAAVVVPGTAPGGVRHEMQKTNQVQIGLAFDSVPERDPDSILAALSVNVLSGGMGARLFSEIREKQGLCYSVQAGYQSLRTQGMIFGYAGTVPERAQKTLDAFVHELNRLTDGISADELQRAKIGMKSRVVMNGESSGARAAALMHDMYHIGRPRTLDELRARIEAPTPAMVNSYLERNPVRQLTLVTIGPEPLTPPPTSAPKAG